MPKAQKKPIKKPKVAADPEDDSSSSGNVPEDSVNYENLLSALDKIKKKGGAADASEPEENLDEEFGESDLDGDEMGELELDEDDARLVPDRREVALRIVVWTGRDARCVARGQGCLVLTNTTRRCIEYDYIIINHDISKSAAEVKTILFAERKKRIRQKFIFDFIDKLTK